MHSPFPLKFNFPPHLILHCLAPKFPNANYQVLTSLLMKSKLSFHPICSLFWEALLSFLVWEHATEIWLGLLHKHRVRANAYESTVNNILSKTQCLVSMASQWMVWTFGRSMKVYEKSLASYQLKVFFSFFGDAGRLIKEHFCKPRATKCDAFFAKIAIKLVL